MSVEKALDSGAGGRHGDNDDDIEDKEVQKDSKLNPSSLAWNKVTYLDL